MIRNISFAALILTASVGAASAQQAAPAAPPRPSLTLTSSAFADGGVIPEKYTRVVEKWVSPAFAWSNTPAGTASFTFLLHDIDTAPQKGVTDITHWMAFNIPATATALPEGVANVAQLADGTIQIKAQNGTPGFMGPGFGGPQYHHYTFELFALDTKLALGPDATRAQVLAAMDGHILAKAGYAARFHR